MQMEGSCNARVAQRVEADGAVCDQSPGSSLHHCGSSGITALVLKYVIEMNVLSSWHCSYISILSCRVRAVPGGKPSQKLPSPPWP